MSDTNSDTSPDTDAKEMPFLSHLRELRSRLFISVMSVVLFFILTFTLYQEILEHILTPLPLDKLSILGPTAACMLQIQVSMYLALIFSSPVHIFNIVAFIFPALKPKEQKFIKYGLFASTILSIVGFYVSYIHVLPMALEFLGNFAPDDVSNNWKLQETVLFEFRLVFAFVVLFQLPVVLEILMAMNLLKRRTLLKYQRHIIVLLFVLSALVTPPEIISQIALAVPLIILFYVSILIAKILKFGE